MEKTAWPDPTGGMGSNILSSTLHLGLHLLDLSGLGGVSFGRPHSSAVICHMGTQQASPGMPTWVGPSAPDKFLKMEGRNNNLTEVKTSGGCHCGAAVDPSS